MSINFKNTQANKGVTKKITEKLAKQKHDLDLQFKSRLDKYEAQIEALKADHQANLDSVTADHAQSTQAFKDKISMLESNIKSLQKGISKYQQEEQVSLQTKMQGLKELESQQAQNSQLSSEIDRLKQKLESSVTQN